MKSAERRNGRQPIPRDLELTPVERAVAMEATRTASLGHGKLWYRPLEDAIIRVTKEVPELKPGQLRSVLRRGLVKVWEKSSGDGALAPEEQTILNQFNRAMELHRVQPISPQRFITSLSNRVPLR